MKKRFSSTSKRKSKKGMTQVDWAISLAVFMIYLFWFFAFIRPSATSFVRMDPLVRIAENSIMNEVKLSVERLPLLVPINTFNEYEPIVLNFPFDWNYSNMFLPGVNFLVDSNKLFLIADVRNKSRFNILHSEEEYVHPEPSYYLVSNSGNSRVFNAILEFEDGVVDNLVFGLRQPLKHFNMSIDNTLFIPQANNYTDFKIMAKYLADGDNVRQESYVFANNPRLYSFLTALDFQEHDVKIQATLMNFTLYSAGQIIDGDIEYGSGDCVELEVKKIDFNDGARGITFLFDDAAEVSFCPDAEEQEIYFSADFSLVNETSYKIFMHSGGAEATTSYPVAAKLGFLEQHEGISATKFIELSALSSGELKKRLKYPSTKGLSISLDSEALNSTVGDIPPDNIDVYGSESYRVVLNNYLEKDPAKLNVRVW